MIIHLNAFKSKGEANEWIKEESDRRHITISELLRILAMENDDLYESRKRAHRGSFRWEKVILSSE